MVTQAIGPCGISHVAVVTADLDRFRTFYEDVIGLRTTVVFGPAHAREAVLVAGSVMIQAFEIAGYDPAAHGWSSAMFERGRLDHLGFAVPDVAALTTIRDRLLAAEASSGDIRQLGPMLSLRFADPDGLQGEINCFNADFDPSMLRDGDEIVDPDWVERARQVLHGGSTHPSPPRGRPR